MFNRAVRRPKNRPRQKYGEREAASLSGSFAPSGVPEQSSCVVAIWERSLPEAEAFSQIFTCNWGVQCKSEISDIRQTVRKTTSTVPGLISFAGNFQKQKRNKLVRSCFFDKNLMSPDTLSLTEYVSVIKSFLTKMSVISLLHWTPQLY